MAQSVRTATENDIPQLLDLMAAFYMESGYAQNRDLSQKAFRELIQNPSLGQVWLLEQDGQAGGYIVLTLGYSMEYGGRDAFVDDLFILPEYRGRGLGRRGLETLFEECSRREVRAVHLEVGRSNTGAKKLYARYGFKETDRQLMTRRLTEETTGVREE